jgi:hypothetical protein
LASSTHETVPLKLEITASKMDSGSNMSQNLKFLPNNCRAGVFWKIIAAG